MPADLLIIKKRGRKIQLKITQKMRAGFSPENHSIIVNLKDYRDVALMLHDMKDLYNVPVDKAIEFYKSGKSKVWPF